MEISNSLLVALMFVTVLSLGIATLLGTLARYVGRWPEDKPDRAHLAWVVMLLVMHLNLFWQTLEILQVESWGFLGFVFTIAGPVLLFFATSVLDATESRLGEPFILEARFLWLVILLQVWSVSVDLKLGHGFGLPDLPNTLAGVIALAMIAAHSRRATVVGTWAAGLVFLLTAVGRGAGLIT